MKYDVRAEVLAKLQNLQDVLSEKLNICLVLVDSHGIELTLPSGYPIKCFHAEDHNCDCHEHLLATMKNTAASGSNQQYHCPHGQYVTIISTGINSGNKVIFLIAGKIDDPIILDKCTHLLRAIYSLPIRWTGTPQLTRRRKPEKITKDTHARLTNQERVVLSLIASGYSNKDIADKLCISLSTVKSHVAHILQKLNLENRTEAGIYAIENGLVLLKEEQHEI